MVAIVNTDPSLNDALNYNENKVKAKTAECILAVNYPKDLDKLGDTDKLKRLQNLAALNQRTQRNGVHITLNFSPSDSMNTEKMKAIAESYMQKIGFGDQPYLVYEHRDAGHPHVHIVTTNIRENGTAISTYKIGANQSSIAREQLENEFGLVKAKGRGNGEWELPPVNVGKAIYGKGETKKAIADVVNYVSKNYKFASIPEMDAILKQYNVTAYRGEKDSRIYKNGGLMYHLLDENGKRVGVPIKSSLISTKPTLKNLSEQFESNKKAREPFRERIKGYVDLAILQNPGMTINQLEDILKKEKIQVVVRQNEQGIIYGITYVDHKNKTVFNGSELGKNYSAKAIIDRCSPKENKQAFENIQQEVKIPPVRIQNSPQIESYPMENIKRYVSAFKAAPAMNSFTIIPDLSIQHLGHNSTHLGNNSTSFEFSNTRKKKRKRKRY